MCGFVGFTGMLANRREILQRMADRIIHRGPDSEGFYLDGERDDDACALGFRRLSIIDLASGSQPMENEDGSVVIVFNGEIYNFEELRTVLIERGHVFRTRCDTEVILHGYEEYGTEIVKKLRGMFAFVIRDKKRHRLFGARDPFGIKPFYYATPRENVLLFGSEIKSFLEHPAFQAAVNPNALRAYLTFQYSSMAQTFFDGVYKLPAAHYFVYENGRMSTERYWEVDFTKKTTMSYEECACQIDERVRESVRAHRISDVPVGSFLSGGVDSSYITACLMPENTFSVGFGGEKFDETGEAAELSARLGIRSYIKHLTAEECMAAFPAIQYHMDEPQSNPSAVPLYFLAKLAREKVTVVLSGEGADEIYAGYEWYDDSPLMRRYKRIPAPLRRAAAGVTRHLPYFKGHDFILHGTGRPEDYFIGQAYVFPEAEALSILREPYRHGPSVRDIVTPIYRECAGLSEVEKKQYLDLHLWLQGDILLKADKMSMAHSLELRVPYLDKYVMEEAAALPVSYKLDGHDTKAVLRTAANKTLPDAWAHRPKKGFPVPIRDWLREDPICESVRAVLTSDTAAEYFDTNALATLLDAHKAGAAQNQRKIWTAYTFLTWHRQFIG